MIPVDADVGAAAAQVRLEDGRVAAAPNVQSTIVSPGRGSSSSATSVAMTGTCSTAGLLL